ncbi:MAG: Rpn family recombination-promoting nuclease/putative transposase [Methanobrevibacter sp.]|jgi:predicted transposase/invertase (TIGR01784 family)|nr:Rpn family recombination-promoting nuclease/putative transposase [Methanobrevibacter sp.]
MGKEGDNENIGYNGPDPMKDIYFKHCFGIDGREHLNEGIVNAVFEDAGLKTFKNLKLKDKEIVRTYKNKKTVVLDVRSQASNGSEFLIEAQIKDKKNMHNRAIFNWCKVLNSLIKIGHKLKKIPKIALIAFLDYELIDDSEKYHNIYKISNCTAIKEINQDLSEICEIHIVEIPKFRKLKNKNYKNNKLQRFLGFLDDETPLEERKELINMDKDIEECQEIINQAQYDPEMQRTQELFELQEIEINEQMEELREEVREEDNIDFAKKLLNENMPIDFISRLTGLSFEEIEKFNGHK